MTESTANNGNLRTGSCHCDAVIFQVQLSNNLEKLRRCNCSLCRRKGAIMASVPADRLNVVEGAKNLTLYQWNTMQAEHYFCRTCGIYTHHRRRSVPTEFAFNVACIEGIDPFSLGPIAVGDGASQKLAGDN